MRNRLLLAAALILAIACLPACKKHDLTGKGISRVLEKYRSNLVGIASDFDRIENNQAFDVWTGLIISKAGLVITSSSLADRFPEKSEFTLIVELSDGKYSYYKYRIALRAPRTGSLFLAPVSNHPYIENIPLIQSNPSLGIGDSVLQLSILYKRLDKDFMRYYFKAAREVSIITILPSNSAYVTSNLHVDGMSGSPIFNAEGERLIGITGGCDSREFSYADSYIDTVTSSGERVVFPNSLGAFNYSIFRALTPLDANNLLSKEK